MTSTDSKEPVYIAAGDIRRRLAESLKAPSTTFKVRRMVFFSDEWEVIEITMEMVSVGDDACSI